MSPRPQKPLRKSRRTWIEWYRQKITPELVDELAGYFRKGATVKVAAGMIGVPPGVLKMWICEGERQLRELYAPGVETGHPEAEGMLYLACARATAEYLSEHIEDLSSADGASSQWRARAWILERFDEELNPATKVEVTGQSGGPITVEGRAVVGLADVLRFILDRGLAERYGLDPAALERALPGARDVLPDPPDSLQAASEPPALRRA